MYSKIGEMSQQEFMSAAKLLVLTVHFMGLLLHTQVCLVHGVLSQRWLVPSDQRPTQELQIYVSMSPVKLQIGNKNAQKEGLGTLQHL